MNALYLIGCRVKSNRQNSALKIYQKRDIPHVFKLDPCLGKTGKSKQEAKNKKFSNISAKSAQIFT